jgi:small redox-active disulfide protein 2
MNIKILGTGCPNCQRLEANTKQALEELKLEAEVEKITEIADIMSYGIMGTPALVVDGEVKVYGRVAEVKEIKEILIK